jgi:hypothetical protein
MTTATTTPRRRAPWRPTRRLSDWAFRYAIPGRHHSLDISLMALMTIREMGY